MVFSLAAGLANCASEGGGDDGSTGTAADTTAPSVSSTSPADQGTATSNTAEVTVTLDETPDTSVAPTVKVEHINYWQTGYTITGTDDGQTAQYEYPVGTVTVDGTDKTHTIVTYSDKTVTIKFPWVRWPGNASYNITVNGFKDTAGNTMTTAHKWRFVVDDDDDSYNAGGELTNIQTATAASSPNNVDRYVQDNNTDKRYFTACVLGMSGGTCTGVARTLDWLDALKACIALNGDSFAGRTNWRLLSAAEADEIANDGSGIDSGFTFPNNPENLWVALNTSNDATTVSRRITNEASNNVAGTTSTMRVVCASSP